jgi:hypothetical protein
MNDFEFQWENISSSGHAAGRLRVYPDHLLDFFISYSLSGHREMVIEAKGLSNNFNDLPSFENLDLVFNQTNTGISIGLALTDSELVKSFSVMCYDIAERSRRGESIEAAAVIVVECLRSWAALLKRRGKIGLTRNEAIGLWGELSTIDALLSEKNIKESPIIFGWRGPNGDQRDIGYNNTRIEVKAQLSTQSIGLKITSLDQLDDRGDHLKVVLNRISPSETGISITNLIGKIQEILTTNRLAQSEFDRKVMLAEFDSNLDVCQELFGLDERIIFDVRDGFPRLIPSTVASGIKNTSYEISGSSILQYQISWIELVEDLGDNT